MTIKLKFPQPRIVLKDNRPTLEYMLTEKQSEFYNHTARFKVMAKGRRFGGTISAAMYVLEQMINNNGIRVLWVDVIYSNISRYYKRYFYPVLKKMPPDTWKWQDQLKILSIGDSYMDMRSADHPEAIEGQGYDLIVMNEAGEILQDANLWNVTVAPMALDGDAPCLFIGTPKGKTNKRDQEEHLYYTFYKNGLPKVEGGKELPNWKSFHFTTYDNPSISKESIEELTENIPPNERRQEILAEFVDIAAEQIFKESWFEIVQCLPEPSAVVRRCIALDTAYETKKTSDYSAGVVIYQTRDAYYVIDVINEKYEFPELLKAVEGLYQRYPVDVVLVEGKASGKSLVQSLKANSTIPVRELQPQGDKISRANAITPTCARNVVKIVEGAWNRMFIRQLLNFPCGRDDMVDAFAEGLTEMKDFRGNMNPTVYQTPKPAGKGDLGGYARTFSLRSNAGILRNSYLT